MKNIFNTIIMSFLAMIAMSCSRNEDLAKYNNIGGATLTTDASTIILSKVNAANHAITFNWQPPSYSPNLAPQNELQFAMKGTNFANPYTVVLDPSVKSLSMTQADLNSIMTKVIVPFNSSSSTQIEVRIKSYFPNISSIDPLYSSVNTLTVTPYSLQSFLYMPGDYQSWDPTSANRLVSPISNGKYVGYINFTDKNGSFKIKQTPDNDWSVNYGSADSKTLTLNGPNIPAPGLGYYQILVDMNANTFTMTPYSIGIVGDGTVNGWNGPDMQMKWDDASLSWVFTGNFTTGSIKFRLNNDWGTNWGDVSSTASGVLTTSNGNNIAVTAGTHTIKINSLTWVYTIQ